jgi:dTDP-4-dehydrorhamnose 3,5-epimerase
MKFESLGIHQAVGVSPEPHADRRGLFARTFCAEEFTRTGLPSTYVQCSTSFNRRRATLRGLHFQWPPSQEGKLVRCVRGKIHDVLLDLRPRSPTYLQHVSVVLDEDNRKSVFVPPGVAHGFQTLVDASEVLYQMTDFYSPELSAGYRWNDRFFGISWPMTVDIVISDRDAEYPDFDRTAHEARLRGLA